MKAVRTLDPKLARLLSDLVEIWYTSLVRGKAIHVQVWTGPEDSRRLRLSNFHDNQHMKVVRLSALHTGRLRISFFGRASNLYLCLYNQLFALYHYIFKFLTP